MTDAGGLLEDHDASAMAVAVPGTQQGSGCHPARPQGVAGLLLQVLRVVVHSHIVAHVPAKNSALRSAVMNSLWEMCTAKCKPHFQVLKPVLCGFTGCGFLTERDVVTTVEKVQHYLYSPHSRTRNCTCLLLTCMYLL